jgi:hypothetical protein
LNRKLVKGLTRGSRQPYLHLTFVKSSPTVASVAVAGRAAVMFSRGRGVKTARSRVAMIADLRPCSTSFGSPQPTGWAEVRGEVDMFEMVNEDKAEPKDRKLLLMKIAAFVVALGALAGIVYFMAFASAH